jgi:hypothetical protein
MPHHRFPGMSPAFPARRERELLVPLADGFELHRGGKELHDDRFWKRFSPFAFAACGVAPIVE